MRSSKLTVHSTVHDGGCLLRVSGTIDESADVQALLPQNAEVVVYDLDGVRRITSYGVLQWVKMLREVRARYYAFMRCRPSIVRQFNMVSGFGKQGEVLSIYLPYFCEACDQEFETLLDLRTDFNVIMSEQPPEARCPTCRAIAEFDDVPKSYLAFSVDYPRPNPPDLAQRLCSEALRSSGLMPGVPASVRPSRAPSGPQEPVNLAAQLFGGDTLRTASAPRQPQRDEGFAAAKEPNPESVDRLRKLQDELDITRDRLSRMIKDRKSKT